MAKMKPVSIRVEFEKEDVLLSLVLKKDGHFLVVHNQRCVECNRDEVVIVFGNIARPCVWLRMFRRALEESGLPERQKNLFREIIASAISSPAPQPEKVRIRK